MKNKSLAALFRHTFLMTLAACLTATVLTYVPVSYTHLDVYKRQPIFQYNKKFSD